MLCTMTFKVQTIQCVMLTKYRLQKVAKKMSYTCRPTFYLKKLNNKNCLKKVSGLQYEIVRLKGKYFWNGSHTIPMQRPFLPKISYHRNVSLAVYSPILYFSFCQKVNLHLYKGASLALLLFNNGLLKMPSTSTTALSVVDVKPCIIKISINYR